jgi:hypothetical protein
VQADPRSHIDGDRATALQEEHRPALLANQLRPEHRWGTPCRAFNLCIDLGDAVRRALSDVQDTIAVAEPSLLRVPQPAMHMSVAWLLPVHLELSAAEKEDLWAANAQDWLAGIAGELTGLRRFRLCCSRVVATESAVIALAWPTGQINELRRKLSRRLRIPGDVSTGDLLHTTLFRYTGPVGDPRALITAAASIDVQIEVPVTELLVIRERVFPTLESDIPHRFPLPG